MKDDLVSEYGRHYKQKHAPRFDNKDDYKLGLIMSERKPDEFEKFVALRNDGLVQRLEAESLSYAQGVDPNAGIISSFVARVKASAHTKQMKSMTEAIDATRAFTEHVWAMKMDADGRVEQLRRNLQISALEHTIAIEGLEGQKNIALAAKEKGLDTSSYIEVQKQNELNKLDRQQRFELDVLELAKERQSLTHRLQAALGIRLMERKEIGLLVNELFDLYARIEDTRIKGTQRQLALLESHAESLQKEINGRNDRLLQGVCGNDRSGGNENPNVAGDLRLSLEADAESG